MSEQPSQSQEPGLIARALLERLAANRLPRPLARYVYRRLDEDPRLAAFYDTLRRVERASAGSPPLSDAQASLVKDRLFAGPAAAPLAAREPRARAALWPRAAIALAGAAALVLVVSRLGPASPVPDDTWSMRGASQQGMGLRVRCVAAERDRVLAEAEAGQGSAVAAPALACPHEGLLAWSATNRGDAGAYLFVVGIAAGGGLRWLAPFDSQSRSVSVPPRAVDEVLDELAALSSLPQDERLTVFAVFSRAPVTASEVAAAVERADREGHAVEKLARLPLQSTFQARIDLSLAPAGAP